MKRNVAAIVLVLVAVALLLGYRRCRSAESRSGAAAPGAAAAGARDVAATRRNPRAAIDPHTLARGRIAGAVRASGGAAIGGALVCAEIWSEDLAEEETRTPLCAVAGADGSYALTDLIPAAYTLFASAPRFVPARWRAKDETALRLEAGEQRSGVDILLEGGAVEVHGIASDIGGGPVAGALVTVTSTGSWYQRDKGGFVRTDAQGHFTVWAKAGGIAVSAAAEGYSSGATDGVAPGQWIEVLLTPESVLAGVVVEAGSRAPVARATVSVGDDWRWGGDSDTGRGSAITDEHGRFRITRLPPGRYKPEASGIGLHGQAAESVLLGLGQSAEEVQIEVHPAAVVSGRIVIDDGAGAKKPCEHGMLGLSNDKRGRSYWGATEADGSLRVRSVLPGTYQVSVACDDHVEKERQKDLVVAADDLRDLEWIVTAGGTLRGKVVSKRGEPIAGADVRARTTGGDPRGQRSWQLVQSEADGSFEVRGLVAGDYLVDAEVRNHPDAKEPRKVAVPARGEATVELVIEDGGTIRGTVVDDRGEPVGGVRVSAGTGRWGRGGETRTVDDGTFVMEGVAPGETRVVAQRGWWDELRKPGTGDDDVQGERVTVVEGETVTVRLVVERSADRIRGVVVDATGQSVADAFVTSQRESEAAGAAPGGAVRSSHWGWDRRPVMAGTDGSFELTGLTRGHYTVRAYRRGGGEAVEEHVAAGGRTRLVLKPTATVSGEVVVTGGGAPDEMTVTVEDAKRGYSRGEHFFRTGGIFILRDLPAGHFELSAESAEGRAVAELTLTDGETKSGLRLTMEATATVRGKLVELDTATPAAGMQMHAIPIKGAGTIVFRSGGDNKNVSAADGSFELTDVPPGKILLRGFPQDWETSPYSVASAVVTIPAGGVHDVGTIEVPRRRINMRERGGDLGFDLAEAAPDVEPDQRVLQVSHVRPDGPAAGTGLVPGDVIVSVDGHDVRGARSQLYRALILVPAGTTVQLGLARGATVAIKTGPPL